MTSEAGKRLLRAMHSEGLFEDELLAEVLAEARAEARAEGPECCDWRHVWPCPAEARCDEPGCEAQATCGWPEPDKSRYRWGCGDHYRAALADHA